MKTIFTRRKTALRRILIAAVLLFLVNHILLIGLVLPIQAIRHNEERMGTGRTAVVCRDWDREWNWRYLTYLTESETVTLLSRAKLSLLGWMDSFGVALDCSEPAPLYAGYWEALCADGVLSLYVFGRVDNPAIDRLELEVCCDETYIREQALREMPQISSDRTEWLEKDGRTYFLLKFPSGTGTRVLPEIAGYDTAGRELVRLPIEDHTSTYYA